MYISLAGSWELSFDTENPLYNQTINLPGTTEIEKLYSPNTRKEAPSTLYLGREYKHHGVAWYKRQILIPNTWTGLNVQLHLGRTKFTKVYVDGNYIGGSYETLIPQVHELGVLTPGTHELVICVDNALEQYDCFPKSLYQGHQYTDHTQSNWNGIIGEIKLTCYTEAYIKEVLLLGDNELNINAKVYIDLSKASSFDEENKKDRSYFVELEVLKYGKELIWEGKDCFSNISSSQSVTIEIPKNLLLQWDEFTPVWYEVRVKLSDCNHNMLCPVYTSITGNRSLSTKGRELLLNEKRISLRGSLDCAIYPLTGAAPSSVEEWKRIFQSVMEYGINHYRFHSWCPEEAAFIAADELGFYLQVELSCFANGLYLLTDEKYDKVLEDYLYDQSEKIIRAYGNHPSFILFAVGNEMVGNIKAFELLLKHLKNIRKDLLYTQGSNNFLENPTKCVEDDVYIMMRTTKTDNIRASFSHNDMPLGYLQGKERQGSYIDYNEASRISHVPLISHEIGQYQSLIRIKDKEKFTGPLRPDAWNIIEERFKEKGLLDKNEEFYKASGALLVACYKEEIEASLRSNEMSGFQLLGLQDFPGQGTALVGVLDSFLESKGFIHPNNFRQFCDRVVVLGKFKSYTYTYTETIPLTVEVYNYGGCDLCNDLKIKLMMGSKTYLEELEFDQDALIYETVVKDIKAADRSLNHSITLELALAEDKIINTIKKENKGMDVTLLLEYGDIRNSYTLWIFDDKPYELINNNIIIKDKLDEEVMELAKQGSKVLVCSNQMVDTIEGFYTSDFWCYPMFKEACINTGKPVAPGTLGLLIDNKHKALEKFPSKTYSEWLWQPIVMNSAPVILDKEEDITMIVQVIDNFDRNHTLGLIYEQKLGKGKILVCASDLLEQMDVTESANLLRSLVEYLENS